MTSVSTKHLSIRQLQALSDVKRLELPDVSSQSYYKDIKTCPLLCSAHLSLSLLLPSSSLHPSIPHCPISPSLPRALQRRFPLFLPVHPPVLNKQTSSGWLVSPIYNSSQTNYSGDVCQTQENTSSSTLERRREMQNLVVPQIQLTEKKNLTFTRRFNWCFRLCIVWKTQRGTRNNTRARLVKLESQRPTPTYLETVRVLALSRRPSLRHRSPSSPRALSTAVPGPASGVQCREVLRIPPELRPNRLW